MAVYVPLSGFVPTTLQIYCNDFKNLFENFEEWTSRYEFWICFCKKIPYHTQKNLPGDWTDSKFCKMNLTLRILDMFL